MESELAEVQNVIKLIQTFPMQLHKVTQSTILKNKAKTQEQVNCIMLSVRQNIGLCVNRLLSAV